MYGAPHERRATNFPKSACKTGSRRDVTDAMLGYYERGHEATLVVAVADPRGWHFADPRTREPVAVRLDTVWVKACKSVYAAAGIVQRLRDPQRIRRAA